MTELSKWRSRLLLGAIIIGAVPTSVFAQTQNTASEPTYADLADYADPAQVVVKAKIRKQATVAPERAPGLAAGYARLYIEAETLALIAGDVPVGESLKYVVDVPVNSKGKPPKLRKEDVVTFGRTVPGRPGEIQLVAPSSQLLWSPELETRLRPILTALVAADAPPVVTGIRDALSIEGNLVGESETQIFLSTETRDPVSISVLRVPGQQPAWGVSWTEIVDQAARPPQRDTLEWYRLACFLPERIEPGAFLTSDPDSTMRAQEDYAFVLSRLGDCSRNL